MVTHQVQAPCRRHRALGLPAAEASVGMKGILKEGKEQGKSEATALLARNLAQNPYLTPQTKKTHKIRTERQQNIRGPSRCHLGALGLVKQLPHSRGQGQGQGSHHYRGPVGLKALPGTRSQGAMLYSRVSCPCVDLSSTEP